MKCDLVRKNMVESVDTYAHASLWNLQIQKF